MPFMLSSSDPSGRTETPGILYRDPAAACGQVGWYMLDESETVVLRLVVADARLTDPVRRKIDELRALVAATPIKLELVG